MKQNNTYLAGLDIGSTTAKLVLVDGTGQSVFSRYQRHYARITDTVSVFFNEVLEDLGNCRIQLAVTGSAGMGMSREMDLPFVQEVIATHELVRQLYPKVQTVVDIGGEDSKMIFLSSDRPPDIRMNGSCAGGTGAFIDQLAALLNCSPDDLNTLAKQHTQVYPIASRCGVFAKTDVQNLLSRNVPVPDIAASVFHAVAIQCLNTLARGYDIRSKLLLCGGVFTFLPELVKAFLNVLDLPVSDTVVSDTPALLPAIGAAMFSRQHDTRFFVSDLFKDMAINQTRSHAQNNRLTPLFSTKNDRESWEKNRRQIQIPRMAISEYPSSECFVGVDSGSTTTKIIALGTKNQVLFSWYQNNDGNPIQAVIRGLTALRDEITAHHPCLAITGTAVTGYGEDLIRTAFGMDMGLVETIAHFEAARHMDPDVSFILDIGGQDMKAIFIRNGAICRIELNEACSSGCGSFIETFAGSLGYRVNAFANLAMEAESPCDLGTRCTVFMNSRVKQALRENAKVADISAGLSFAVVKNCLFKVLKLIDTKQMGTHIVLQGGAGKNPSIVRALEILAEVRVTHSDMPEMMGAFGAALAARNWIEKKKARVTPLFSAIHHLETIANFTTRQIVCHGCENACAVTRFIFSNGRSFYSGNRCEKIFGSKGRDFFEKGFDFADFKYRLLFDRNLSPHTHPKWTVGIPRCLNFYENFAFWHAFFIHCGINVVLSGPSTMAMSDTAKGSIMSDNICFPAKLANAHVLDLVRRGVDRIFYPLVMYEYDEFQQVVNTFNCPIVSSYTDVIDSSLDLNSRKGIPLDKPVITFKDEALLAKACVAYLRPLGVNGSRIRAAVKKGLAAQKEYKQTIREKGAQRVRLAKQDQRLLVILCGRPYHIDPLINQKIPQILTGFGVDFITEDAVPDTGNTAFDTLQVLTQWAYPNRLYHAASWVARQPAHIQMIQLNSFGCGPDAVAIEENRQILETGGKNQTLVKVDDISSTGSVRLRIRSMVASLKRQNSPHRPGQEARRTTPHFEKKDRKRQIIAPFFADNYSAYLPPVFETAGYRLEILPPPDRVSVEIGLRYAGNDICYPAVLVTGDIIKALKTGRYDPETIAVGITQTGGQCRASSYLSLIKKAMVAAGFEQIPVISVTSAQGLTHQPGFDINWLKLLKLLFVTTMYADCIAKMYYATAVREIHGGTSRNLRKKYIAAAHACILSRDYDRFFSLLDAAVADFNRVAIDDKVVGKIGIVGEIYIKYNAFGNQFLTDFLMENRVEPVIPPILDYFIQDFVNYRENIRAHIRHRKLTDILGQFIETFLNTFHKKINHRFSAFRFYTPFHDIRQVADKAGKILSLVNQFGEGWLIPGEIAGLAEDGVTHVVSVQPFGCIANHIVSKGVEKRIKALYPDMNLLYLDFDAGTSEVNIRNRLHFMVESVKARFEDRHRSVLT
ncbi:MAG: acyl-CoA dehydratase activase [Desulfotignum sp.]|nr:acyl-CoA dehydratase activase [Desulfotignum sp.]MCF8136053.1 acyl-CoA dehydratase activase [Desulfotignum sp.]